MMMCKICELYEKSANNSHAVPYKSHVCVIQCVCRSYNAHVPNIITHMLSYTKHLRVDAICTLVNVVAYGAIQLDCVL